jgi:hypothetical protein
MSRPARVWLTDRWRDNFSGVTIPVVAVALLFWVCVFLVYFTSVSTTPLEFFFGRFEPPPVNGGTWIDAGVDASTGLTRQERWLLPDGRPKASYLLHQVRYRDVASGSIVRVEPEQRVRRKRLQPRA